MGARVVRIEPPGGSQTRLRGPFALDSSGNIKSLYWAAYNSNKKGISLSLDTEAGRQIFLRLVDRSDAILESFQPGYLDSLNIGFATLIKRNPQLVHTTMTPFGSTGPYAGFVSTDLISSSMGGMPFVSGDEDRPPVRISFPQAELVAGSQAFGATVAALRHSRNNKSGQHVDVSEQISVIWTLMNATPFPKLHGTDVTRAGAFRKRGPIDARHVFKCADGYVSMNAQARTLKGFIEWMSEETEIEKEILSFNIDKWDLKPDSDPNGKEAIEFKTIEKSIEKFLLNKTKNEIFERALSSRLLVAPCNTVEDIRKSPQLDARSFWIDIYHPEFGKDITHLGPYIKMSETPLRVYSPSSSVGSDNEEVFIDFGINRTEIDELKRQEII
jgi:crotonobetainyl-CoA:carnitine CoA-transferase CaiB-like acyl-CoA transferase|tara:strand:- start:2260 stop:3417 length:1158 start_codon:yes stop_codon:yes gene_type:complete